MMRLAADLILSGSSPKYAEVDIAVSTILALYSRRSCGWGRTLTSLNNRQDYLKLKGLVGWKITSHHKLLFPRFLDGDSFRLGFKNPPLTHQLRASRAKSTFHSRTIFLCTTSHCFFTDCSDNRSSLMRRHRTTS